MINVEDMHDALGVLHNARAEAEYAEESRQRAWSAYLRARERAQDAQLALTDAEREVVRAAGRLASEPARLNRDERRAQVLAGVDDRYRSEYDDRIADIPF